MTQAQILGLFLCPTLCFQALRASYEPHLPDTVSCHLRVHCSAHHPSPGPSPPPPGRSLFCPLPFVTAGAQHSSQMVLSKYVPLFRAPHLLRDRAPLQPPSPPPSSAPHQPPRPPAVPQQPEPARVVGRPSGRPSHGWPRGLGTFSGACPAARVLRPLPPFISPTPLSSVLPPFICLSPLASRGQQFFRFAHCCILSLYNYLQKRQVNRRGVTGPLMGSTWPGHNTSPPLRDAGTEDLPFTGASFSVSGGLFSSNLFGLRDNCV